MVGRDHGLAIHLRFMDGPYPALHVGLDEVRTKLVTDPEVAARDLESLQVKVGTGEIALLRAFVHDAVGHFLVRVVQEHGLQSLELAGLEVHRVAVEEQHEVGGVGFGSGAVVGQQPEAAVGHALDARVALHRLAGKRQRDASGTAGGLAFDAADFLDALTGGEFAAGLQVGGCVLGGRQEGLRRQDGMASQACGVGRLGVNRGQGEQGARSGRDQFEMHGAVR